MKEFEKIIVSDIRKKKSPGVVINNFFSLMTIIIVSVVLLWYVNFIRPGQIAKEKQEKANALYKAKIEAYNKQREEEIKRSQLYNRKK